jgi:hypothetical protein
MIKFFSFSFLCAISLLAQESQNTKVLSQYQLAAKEHGLILKDYVSKNDGVQLGWCTHIAFGPGEQEIISDLKNNRLIYRNNAKESFQVSPIAVKGLHSLAYNPADKLYYVNDTANHRMISFADLSKDEIAVERKEMAGVKLQRPHDVVIDPNSSWIYAINPNTGQVFRFTALGENESVLAVPTKGYARALTFANGKLYVIGSSKGRIIEILDWDKKQFKIYDSYDPTGKQGPAGSWTKTGLVLNDAEFFNGYWYASSYFTKGYAKGTEYDINKFIRFKTLDDLVKGNWTDLSDLLPSGITPYYLTVNKNKLYLAIFNHHSPGKGDAILQFSEK